MNKSNFPYLITEAYNNWAYRKGIVRKLNISLFKTFWTQIKLIAKDIFIIETEDEHKKTPNTEKASSNFEKNCRMSVPNKV